MSDNAWTQLRNWLGIGARAPVAEGGFQDPTRTRKKAKEEVPPLSPGTVVEGRQRWEVLGAVGKGGMSTVVCARCLDPDGPAEAALKQLRYHHEDEQALLRTKREFSALLAIKSDRIPKVYDWCLEGHTLFVAMEYFPEGALTAKLRKGGPLSDPDAWRLLSDLSDALAAAHAASLLHLDVKPGNVLIDGKGGFALTDFGIATSARWAEESTYDVGLGTPGYQAPEQRWRRPDLYDSRTDLYSLGALVWAAVTGVNPASDAARHLWAETWDEKEGLPPMSTFRTFVDPQLEKVVQRLLRQDPARRPGSAAEVRSWVQAHQQGRPIQRHLGSALSQQECKEVAHHILDPLWAHLFQSVDRGMIRVEPGEYLCRQGDDAHTAWVLLRGKVKVLVGTREVATIDREGTFLGEVAALTGGRRTASLVAVDEVVLYPVDPARLERWVTSDPAVGVRLIKTMARRLARST